MTAPRHWRGCGQRVILRATHSGRGRAPGVSDGERQFSRLPSVHIGEFGPNGVTSGGFAAKACASSSSFLTDFHRISSGLATSGADSGQRSPRWLRSATLGVLVGPQRKVAARAGRDKPAVWLVIEWFTAFQIGRSGRSQLVPVGWASVRKGRAAVARPGGVAWGTHFSFSGPQPFRPPSDLPPYWLFLRVFFRYALMAGSV